MTTPSRNSHRWRAVAPLALAYPMTALDLTMVNASLPTIGRDLHFPEPVHPKQVNAPLPQLSQASVKRRVPYRERQTELSLRGPRLKHTRAAIASASRETPNSRVLAIPGSASRTHTPGAPAVNRRSSAANSDSRPTNPAPRHRHGYLITLMPRRPIPASIAP